MSYPIKTIAFHESALNKIINREASRIENQTDLSDCALSSWADSTMISYHRHAIELLKCGLDVYGEEIPCRNANVLVDANGKIISTKLVSDKFDNLNWSLTDEQRTKYSRYAIPFTVQGSKSRIQSRLGMKQIKMMCKVKPFFVTSCAFVGSGVSFKTVVI